MFVGIKHFLLGMPALSMRKQHLYSNDLHRSCRAYIECTEVAYMAGLIILAVLAAFGALSALWALFGFLLPGHRGTVMVCLCRGEADAEPVLRHFGWLRDWGLIRGPLLLIDGGMTDEERMRLLSRGHRVEFCTMEELPSRLEQERKELGRTGT